VDTYALKKITGNGLNQGPRKQTPNKTQKTTKQNKKKKKN